MKRDLLSDKIFSIISHSDSPMTVNGIYFALQNKAVSRNMIISRLVWLRMAGLIEKGEMQIENRKINIYRKKER